MNGKKKLQLQSFKQHFVDVSGWTVLWLLKLLPSLRRYYSSILMYLKTSYT